MQLTVSGPEFEVLEEERVVEEGERVEDVEGGLNVMDTDDLSDTGG